MKPQLLKLRGFKGIRSGSGKEEICLALSGNTGLVALTGTNGSGKTTVLDNLHPYRIMPCRSGSYSPRSFSYYNECYGNDATKELHFDVEGRRFKSLLLIDAERKKQEAYLYEWKKGKWEPLCDGKVDNYDRAVTELLGSPQLFFTSVFRCQDAPRLSDYTKGEIKDIFIELLSIESLREIGIKGKEHKVSILQEIDMLKKEGEKLAVLAVRSKKAKEDSNSLQKEIDVSEKEISLNAEQISKKQEEIRKLEGQVALYKKMEEEKLVVEAKIREITEKVDTVKRVLATAEAVKEASTDTQRHHCKLELLKKELPELEQKIGKLQTEERDCREVEKKIIEAKRSLSDLCLKQTHKQDALKKDLRRARESARLLGEVPCGSEYHGKCQFLKNAVKDRETMPKVMSELQGFDEKSVGEIDLETQIKNLESSMRPLDKIMACLKVLEIEKNGILEDIRKTESELAKYSALADKLSEVKFNESILPGMEKELKKLNAMKFDLDESPARAMSKVESEIGELLDAQGRITGEQQVKLQNMAVLKKVIADGAEVEKELVSLNERIDTMSKDVSEWAVIEQAFGNNGIVALEIDDAGPAISAVANDLLLNCFGPRFTVRIDTQAARSSGKGLKEIFDIVVFDSERDESKSLKSMSGGEKVWVEEAITRSISLYNARKSGRKFHALFTDEKDGALDYQRKKEFMAMKRRVMELGEYDVEYFISHSPEIQEIADASIDMQSAQERR